ncbi:MAG: polyketide synthase, partial [Pseudomonadota bacterium]
MLSPEGLCRAFDAHGQGYVRSEGCLACVLRRGDASPWPGQKAMAGIVDVGINADGKTVGLSSPSHTHQAGLLDRIYARAEVDPDDLAFVEAHGTGTRVGDPAEAQSVGSALAMQRRSALPIGSVKTNIGHLEPASGLAGLAKACLALENDLLPASLHCEEPNPVQGARCWF